MINQAIKCSCKSIAEFCDLWANIVPINHIINFLQAFINATGNISPQSFPVLFFNELSDLISNSLYRTCDRNFFKHITSRWASIFVSADCPCTVYAIIISIKFINRAKISFYFLCSFLSAIRCLIQTGSIIFLNAYCFCKSFLPS